MLVSPTTPPTQPSSPPATLSTTTSTLLLTKRPRSTIGTPAIACPTSTLLSETPTISTAAGTIGSSPLMTSDSQHRRRTIHGNLSAVSSVTNPNTQTTMDNSNPATAISKLGTDSTVIISAAPTDVQSVGKQGDCNTSVQKDDVEEGQGEEVDAADRRDSPQQDNNDPTTQVSTGKIPTTKQESDTGAGSKHDWSSSSRKNSTAATKAAEAAEVVAAVDARTEAHVGVESMPSNANPSRSSSSISLAGLARGVAAQSHVPLSPTSPTIRPSPANKVLSRPLSTSQLTSSTIVMPHLSPTPARYADFNLATLGQLSPSASTATTSLTRSDTANGAPLMPFLLSPTSPPLTCTPTSIHPGAGTHHQHHNSNSSSGSYFSLQASTKARPSSAVSSPTSYPTHQPMFLGSSNSTYHIVGSSGERIPTLSTGGGGASDAISLLDLDDSQDIVMIDSNGNSSGIGGTAHAVVGQTMASASAAIVTPSSATLSSTAAAAAAASASSGGSGNPYSTSTIRPFSFASTLSNHLDFFDLSSSKHDGSSLHGSSSTSTSNPSATATATTAPNPCVSTGSFSSTHGNSGNGTPAASSAAAALQSFHQQQQTLKESAAAARSSVPTLTAQAKRDAMQRAALIAAMQQNGGAKLLMQAHRAGRRHDRPSRTIRFGEFHKICEIEQGFVKNKSLIAHGRTLVTTTVAKKLNKEGDSSIMVLYLFTDVLVTGIEKTCHHIAAQEALATTIPAKESVAASEPSAGESEASMRKKIKPLLNNPYAGHLENQQVSRIIQVQADIIENSEEPLLKVTIPSATYTLLFTETSERDDFLRCLNETTVAHKHHLLSQSKYLADLKKFKRHSAFPFDTSFLKTWGIPGGLNLVNGVAAAPHPYLYHQGAAMSSAGGPGAGGSSTSGTGANAGGATIKASTSSRPNRDSAAGSEALYGDHPMAAFMTSSPVTSPGGLLDHFSPQYYLQGNYNSTIRPQSTAGSFFNFSLVGGGGSSSSGYHGYSNESSSGNSEQQHQQHQQHYSYFSTLRGGGDRSSTGSAFDPTWFLKASETIKAVTSRRNSTQAHASAGLTAPIDAHSSDEAAGMASELGEEGHPRDNSSAIVSATSGNNSTTKPPRWSTLATAPAAATITTTATTSTSNTGSGGGMTITTTTTTTTAASSSSASNSAAAGGGIASSGGAASNPSSPISNTNMMTGTWARPMRKGGVDWVRDEDVAICMVCATTKFGVLVRKHHCRLCGRIICWRCCQMKEALQQTSSGALETKYIRVCLDCIDQHQQWLLANSGGAQQQQQQQQQQGVIGKLLSMSSSSSTMTGYLRGNTIADSPSGPAAAPHHGNPHRASMYKINVESVSEVDDEEEEDDEDNEDDGEEGGDTVSIDSQNRHHHISNDEDDDEDDHSIHSTARIAARRRRQLAMVHPPPQRQSIYSLTTATRVKSRAAAMEAAAAAAAAHMASITTNKKTPLPFDKTTTAALENEPGQDPDSTIKASKHRKGAKTQDLESVMRNLRIPDAPEENDEEGEEERTMEQLLAEEDARLRATMGL